MTGQREKTVAKGRGSKARQVGKQQAGAGLATTTPEQTKTKRDSQVVVTSSSSGAGTTSGTTQPKKAPEKKAPEKKAPEKKATGKNVAGKKSAAQAQAEEEEKARRTRVTAAKADLSGLADPAADGDFLDAGDLTAYADQHATAVAALDAILEQATIADPDAAEAERLVRELDAARTDLRQRAADAEQESDELRAEIGEKVEELPDPADLTSVEVYLDTGDLKALRDANDAVRTAATERTDAKRVTAADRDDTAREVDRQKDAATGLKTKAAVAKAESDSYRTEIGKRAADLPDLLTNVKAKADYLDKDDITAFEKSHTETASALKTATEATRIRKTARDGALKQAIDLADAATALAKKAAEAEVQSDGYRTKLQKNVQDLDDLLVKVQSWPPYLTDAQVNDFAQQHEACVQELSTAAEATWVRKAAYEEAATTFGVAEKAGSQLVAAAEAAMEARKSAETTALQAIRKWARNEPRFDISELNRLNAEMAAAVTAKNWAEVDAKLDAMRDESAKLRGYIDSLDSWARRVADLPERIGNTNLNKNTMRDVFFVPFRNAVLKKPRDDAEVAQLLAQLDHELQSKEDTVGDVAQKRAAGLISANGNPIRERTRAELGADATEQQHIVDALDALKDSSLHTWPGKWGDKHLNVEGNLPGTRGAGGYKEYYVRTVPGRGNVLRLVVHNTTGWVYCSTNHYGSAGSGGSFAKVIDP